MHRLAFARERFGFTITDGRIVEIEMVADPERIGQLDLSILNG